MLVYEKISDIRNTIKDIKQKGLSIGFVPTMGALHAGHLSLIEASKKRSDFTSVSIFVNPLQFAPHEDLQKYPRPRDADLALCKKAGVDLVFYPTVDEIYPAGAATIVEVSGISEVLEGAIRPGHFRGVTTVVAKLFNIMLCDQAFFGQKDYQQQLIIRRMVSDLNMPVEIVTCPIIRDADGLALSSRNAYLTGDERTASLAISRALRQTEEAFRQGEQTPENLRKILRKSLEQEIALKIEYAVLANPTTLREENLSQNELVALVAARVGSTRLIDNIDLRA